MKEHKQAEDPRTPVNIKPSSKAKPAKDPDLAQKYELLKNQYNAVLEVINRTSIISEADKRGNILSVNDKLCEISQYSREECIGKPHSMFRHPDMPAAVFKQLWNTIGSGNVFRGKIKNRKKDGSPYYVDAVITPILGEDGRPEKYLGIRYEITDAELERLYMKDMITAFEELSSAVVEFTTDGIITKANSNFLNAFGYDHENEVVGKHHRIFMNPNEVKSEKYSQFWEALKNGKSQNDVFCRKAKDGSEVWIRAVYAPLKDEVGVVKRVLQVALDISAEKNVSSIC